MAETKRGLNVRFDEDELERLAAAARRIGTSMQSLAHDAIMAEVDGNFDHALMNAQVSIERLVPVVTEREAAQRQEVIGQTDEAPMGSRELRRLQKRSAVA